MTNTSGNISHYEDKADSSHIGTGIEIMARAGYAAKGFVYATVGVLSLMTALGFSDGRITGTRGAISTLRDNPLGSTLLYVIAAGLFGFFLWRCIQAIFDPEGKGDDAKGLARRGGLLISGATYALLGAFTIRLTLGSASGSSEQSGSQERTAMLMEHEWGIWLVGLIGVAIVGVGLYQAYRAYAIPFRDHWKTHQMSHATLVWSTRASRFGIAARAAAFLLIGWFLIQAALQSDPSEAQGLSGALRAFYEQPYGEFWLGTIGAGMLCYGIYCGINARYKRIARPST
jgi:hypothetical protein